jgi:hypothetical protein
VAVVPHLPGELRDHRGCVDRAHGHHRVPGSRHVGSHPANLLLLLVVSFLPFPTRLLGEYIGDEEAASVAVTIYGLNLFLASALVSLLWRYAVREHLIRTGVADADVQMITKRLAPGLAGYVAMIVLGLFLPVVAVLGYLAIAVYIIVPVRALKRAGNRGLTSGWQLPSPPRRLSW